ncbi:hypothetical protein, partial [Arcicella rigui]
MSKSKYKSKEITAENIRSYSLLWVKFLPANGRKELSHDVLLLQLAGRNYHTMFCSCNLQEGIITRCFAPA